MSFRMRIYKEKSFRKKVPTTPEKEPIEHEGPTTSEKQLIKKEPTEHEGPTTSEKQLIKKEPTEHEVPTTPEFIIGNDTILYDTVTGLWKIK
jgi:tartrate dehydratase beta subunit/fumarate hydratase class I family protein